MSIFEFDGGNGSGRGWNYSHPDQEGYTTQITGDVVELSEVQSVNFATKKPEFWSDGNAKLNICITIMQADGSEIDWIFGPGGRGPKASAAMVAVRTALINAGFKGASLTEIAGCNITVATQDGVYNNTNPRPWGVQINGKGTNAYRGLKKFQPQQPQARVQPQAAPAPLQPQAAPAPLQQQVAQNPGMQAAMRAQAAYTAAQNVVNTAQQQMQNAMPLQQPQQVAPQPEYPSVYDEYYDYNPNA